jgi:hypothetical protein
MSKKDLLSEAQIRRFQSLANIPVLSEVNARVANQTPPAGGMDEEQRGSMQEMGDPMMDPAAPALPAEAPPMDMPPEDGMEVDMGGGDVDPDKQAAFEAAVRALADSMGIEIELEGGAGGEEDGMGDLEVDSDSEGSEGGEEAEVDFGGAEGGEESDEEEEVDEALSEDGLVETVLNRVMARLVSEAKKKKLSVKEKMKQKKEKKKEELEEATDSKGGGPLLSKGGNKHDVWKGHPDMKMGKGEKGGSGGHKLEDMPAKAEHTVTHGKTNLATKGGNKKKV